MTGSGAPDAEGRPEVRGPAQELAEDESTLGRTTVGVEGVARGVRWSTLSAVVLRFGQFSMGIVAARIIAPEQFGTFAVALTVYGIVLTISDAGVGQALIREVHRTGVIAPTATTINFAMTFITAGLMALCAGPLASTLGAPAAAPAIIVLALTMVAGSFGSIPACILARDYRQRERFYSDLANFLVSSVLLVVLARAGQGVMALAWSRLAGQVVSGVMLNLVVHERYWPGVNPRVLRELLAFSLPMAGAGALIVAISNVDTVAMARIEGPVQLGYYNLAFTIASWPVGIFSSILMNISVTTFARAQDDPKELLHHVRSAMSTLAAASFPVSAILMALAHPVIRDIYGTRWEAAAPALVVLGLFASVRVTQVLLSDLLTALGETKVLLLLQFVWLCALIPVMILMTSRWGLVGAASAHVVVGVLVVIPSYFWALRTRTRIGVRWLPTAIMMPALGGAAAGIAAWWVAELTSSPWWPIVIGGVVGGVIYLLVTGRWLRRHLGSLRRSYVLGADEDPAAEGAR